MKCDDVQNKFSEYWDMPEYAPDREAVEQHLQHCELCSEQFRLWEESEKLIRDLSVPEEVIGPVDHLNRGVMERIYAEQAWLRPISHKSYHFSRSFRRNTAIVVACLMAMFMSGLLYFAFQNHAADTASSQKVQQLTGLIETASASSDSIVVTAKFNAEVPVASISDPFVLQVMPAYPQYWVALSLLGIIITLLILNWLSRTRS